MENSADILLSDNSENSLDDCFKVQIDNSSGTGCWEADLLNDITGSKVESLRNLASFLENDVVMGVDVMEKLPEVCKEEEAHAEHKNNDANTDSTGKNIPSCEDFSTNPETDILRDINASTSASTNISCGGHEPVVNENGDSDDVSVIDSTNDTALSAKDAIVVDKSESKSSSNPLIDGVIKSDVRAVQESLPISIVKKRKDDKEHLIKKKIKSLTSKQTETNDIFNTHSYATADSSKKAPKPRRSHGCCKEDILKALDLNWTREVVYRATSTPGRRLADVYYKSPSGKKLRSLPEVEQYLAQTNDTSVSIEWFTYCKDKLTDHPNETVREAFPQRKANLANVSATTVSNKAKDSNNMKRAKESHSNEKVKIKPIQITPDLNPMCSDRCLGYEGQLPDLMCVSCYCLFHPKCVGIFSSDEQSDYTCKNCMHESNVNISNLLTRPPVAENNKFEKAHSTGTLLTYAKKKTNGDNKYKMKQNIRSSQVLSQLNSEEKQFGYEMIKRADIVPLECVPSSDKMSNCSSSDQMFPAFAQNDNFPEITASVEEIGSKESRNTLTKLNLPDGLSQQQNELNNNWFESSEGKVVLLRVFEFLHTKDLFHVKRTCSTWNEVASNPSLWKNVYLQDLQVISWEKLVEFLQSKDTVMLNMRGMKFGKDSNSVWKDFNAIIPKLPDLRGLILCKSPACILYRIALKLDKLTYFASEGTFDPKPDVANQLRCKLYIGKLNKLTELVSLRVRSMQGLFVPESQFSDGLNDLSALVRLQELSLTTFAAVKASELNFLSQLPSLRKLELGDCKEWSNEHYNKIGGLSGLKHLRLEYGGPQASSALSKVLKKLTSLQQLELVLFPIPSDFDEIMIKLKCLQTLIVWPEMKVEGAKNSLRIISALEKVSFLKKFVWGLVAPDINRRLLTDKKVDDKFSCIPFFSKYSTLTAGQKELTETKISASQLMEHVREVLPSSTIRVVMISNDSYSSFRQALR